MEALKNIASGSSKGNPLVQALLGKDASEEELKSLTQQADR